MTQKFKRAFYIPLNPFYNSHSPQTFYHCHSPESFFAECLHFMLFIKRASVSRDCCVTQPTGWIETIDPAFQSHIHKWLGRTWNERRHCLYKAVFSLPPNMYWQWCTVCYRITVASVLMQELLCLANSFEGILRHCYVMVYCCLLCLESLVRLSPLGDLLGLLHTQDIPWRLWGPHSPGALYRSEYIYIERSYVVQSRQIRTCTAPVSRRLKFEWAWRCDG